MNILITKQNRRIADWTLNWLMGNQKIGGRRSYTYYEISDVIDELFENAPVHKDPSARDLVILNVLNSFLDGDCAASAKDSTAVQLLTVIYRTGKMRGSL